MTAQVSRGPIVIDTDVFGADLIPGSRLAQLYEPVIVGRPAFISFQTAAELRYGALLRAWGPARMLTSPRLPSLKLSIPDRISSSPTPSCGWTARGSDTP